MLHLMAMVAVVVIHPREILLQAIPLPVIHQLEIHRLETLPLEIHPQAI
jgi:hypothetical protein